jgi:hypothetical protein
LDVFIVDEEFKYKDREGDVFDCFKPIYKEETDWSKVPEGTPIYVWSGDEKNSMPYIGYFKEYKENKEYPFLTYDFITKKGDKIQYKEKLWKNAELIPAFQNKK